MFNDKINFNEVPDEISFEKLPDGQYPVIIETIVKEIWVDGGKVNIGWDSRMMESQETYLAIKYQIIEGIFENRLFFNNLHMWAANETRRNISRAIFKKICKTLKLNFDTVTPEQIVDIPFFITIKTSKDGKYTNIVGVDNVAKSNQNVPHLNLNSNVPHLNIINVDDENASFL